MMPNVTSVPSYITTQLTLALNTSTEIIDSWCGQQFGNTQLTKIITASPDTIIRLDPFIVDVSHTLTIIRNGVTLSLGTNYRLVPYEDEDYTTDTYSGIILIDSVTGLPKLWYDDEVDIFNPYNSVSVLGYFYIDIPARIITACQTIAAILYNMWKRQYAMVGGNRITGIEGRSNSSTDILTDEFLQILLNEFRIVKVPVIQSIF